MGTYCVKILAHKSMLDECLGKIGINEALIKKDLGRIDQTPNHAVLEVSHRANLGYAVPQT